MAKKQNISKLSAGSQNGDIPRQGKPQAPQGKWTPEDSPLVFSRHDARLRPECWKTTTEFYKVNGACADVPKKTKFVKGQSPIEEVDRMYTVDSGASLNIMGDRSLSLFLRGQRKPYDSAKRNLVPDADVEETMFKLRRQELLRLCPTRAATLTLKTKMPS